MSESMPGRGMTPEELQTQKKRDVHKGKMLEEGASYIPADNKEGHQLVAAQHQVNTAKHEMFHELGDRAMSDEQQFESNIHRKELLSAFHFDSMEEVNRFIKDDQWYEYSLIGDSEFRLIGPLSEATAKEWAESLGGRASTGAELKKHDFKSFWKRVSFTDENRPAELSVEEKESMESFPFKGFEDKGFIKDTMLYAWKDSEDGRRTIIGPVSDTHKNEWIEKDYRVDTGKRIKDMYEYNITAWNKVIFHKNKESQS